MPRLRPVAWCHVKIFFFAPFLISLAAAGYMIFLSEARLVWRVLVVLLVAGSVVLQALDWFVESINIHFLYPLMTQIVVSLAVYLHQLADGESWRV